MTAISGFSLGAAVIGGLAAADAVVEAPYLTIIGQDAAQFTLVRTGGAKIGLLFGAASEDLVAAISPMLGWTSPRLDVLAVSSAALTTPTRDWLAHQTSVRSLLVLGPIEGSQMPAMRAGVQARSVATPATIRLATDLAVDVLPSFSTAATLGATDSVPALALIRAGASVIAISDDVGALHQQPWRGNVTMVVVPAGDLRQIVATARPQAVAINGGNDRTDQIVPGDLGPPAGQLAILPTYLTDPAVVGLARTELRLPGWTRFVASAGAS